MLQQKATIGQESKALQMKEVMVSLKIFIGWNVPRIRIVLLEAKR